MKRREPHHDPALERVVLADLAYLGRSWQSEITEDSVRGESAVLRRLLIDKGGLLQRYRRMVGERGEARIRALDLRAAIPLPWDEVVLACAGGADVGGIHIALIEKRSRPVPSPPIVVFPTRYYKLSEFLTAPTLIVRGRSASRRDLVKYVANKLGGVHYDPNRGPQEELFELLDAERSTLIHLGLDLVHFEVLAIGQHLLRSPDVSRLVPDRLRPAEMADLDVPKEWILQETLSASSGDENPAGPN